MKSMYFFLFSFILFGFSQSFAQINSAETGGNARAASTVGIFVNLARQAAPPVVIQTEDLKKINRRGLRFQLIDADGKIVARGERRVKYNEQNGTVDVDMVGLPAAPRGRNYRMRISGADQTVVTNVDLK